MIRMPLRFFEIRGPRAGNRMHRCLVSFLGAATVALCAPRAPTAQTPQPSFRFQSNFWVNVHHTLRAESRRREFRAPAMIKTSGLKPDERTAWALALDAYSDYTRRDLVFDAPLIRINNTLTVVADDTPPTRLPPGLDAAARRGLIIGAPIYRAHFWTAQLRLNDRWIEAIRPVIAEHGAAMAAALAHAYRVGWPAAPIVVDAASEAGPNRAYTVDRPPGTAAHTTIQSAHPDLP